MFQKSNTRFTFYVSRFTFYAIAVLLLIAWSPAPQSGAMTVIGQVTNGTAESATPPDLPVTLHIFTGMEEAEVYTTTLSAEGTFAFEDLELEGDETLVARTVYQDVAYTSDFATLEAGQQEISLPITVYETTEEPDAVSITQLHIFVNRMEERVQIGVYSLVSNSGDRAYVGQVDPGLDERTTLAFTLPENTESLRFDGAGLGQRFLEQGQGFADTRPILPGDTTLEVSYSYELPYEPDMPVEQNFGVPVQSIVMVVPGGSLALEGDGITSQGTIDTQMGAALSYAAGPLAADEPLTFSVVPAPEGMLENAGSEGQNLPPTAQRSGSGIMMGIVALAAAAVVIYLMWRTPNPGTMPAQVRSQIEAIAALDADFEAGRIEEKAYRRKRKALKRQVREKMESGS